ncbi:MAG TPA: DUF6596 domain-containing protein [Actinoplanes sp.]|nr:DUF6596 domain-containing protein [Actinoplanes sp.]
MLAVIYLLFNEAYLSSAGDRSYDRDLADDAEFLAALLHRLMPTEPEVAGLLALIRLHQARVAARFDDRGGIIQLPHQDRCRWDHAAIEDAGKLIARAAQRRPGPYQLQAAIVACHAEAKRWEDTDWPQMYVLYTMLLGLQPSPITRLHRAIAPDAVAEMLAERGNPTTGPLFLTPTGTPIYHMYVYRLVKRLARAAGLPAADRLTPHALRHAAITLYLLRTNGNVRGAQLFAGHARPETTMRYDRARRTLSEHGSYDLAGRFGTRTRPGTGSGDRRGMPGP